MNRLERLIEHLTIRLGSCKLDEHDAVFAELMAAKDRYERLLSKREGKQL